MARNRFVKEITDQTAHSVAAVIALTPAMLHPSGQTFAWAGFCLGFVRELTEEGANIELEHVKSAFQSYTDLAVWTIAAGATAFILGV